MISTCWEVVSLYKCYISYLRFIKLIMLVPLLPWASSCVDLSGFQDKGSIQSILRDVGEVAGSPLDRGVLNAHHVAG